MKHLVTRFKSLHHCIKALEPFIRDGKHLQTGKPSKLFGNLRSREILGNWLLCVVLNFEDQSNRYSLSTDPVGGDGIIHDSIEKRAYRTEHTTLPRYNNENHDIELLILKAIEKKQLKGGNAYASGKTLVVFVNTSGGKWHPNRIAKNLPQPLDFESVFILGLQVVINNEYIYAVTSIDEDMCPIWHIRIKEDFSNWEVTRIQ